MCQVLVPGVEPLPHGEHTGVYCSRGDHPHEPTILPQLGGEGGGGGGDRVCLVKLLPGETSASKARRASPLLAHLHHEQVITSTLPRLTGPGTRYSSS